MIFMFTSIKVAPEELRAYYMARNKDLKNFDKEKEKYLEDLTRDKFGQVANYMLKQLATRIEIKDYLKEREQGR